MYSFLSYSSMAKQLFRIRLNLLFQIAHLELAIQHQNEREYLSDTVHSLRAANLSYLIS